MSMVRVTCRLLVLVVAGAVASTCLTLPVAASQEGPRQAAIVRLPFPQDDGSLTPYSFELGYPLVTLVYDTLMWRDRDGVPQPWLARSVEAAPGGRTVTIRLAEGVRWHDGEPLTAADVAFTFRYVAEHPHPRFTPELGAVERVQALDASTVVVTLRHPSPGFLDQPLSDLPILPAHLWRSLPTSRSSPDGLAVGTGPYRLVDHRPGEGYRFQANADYFRGQPAVAEIDVPIIRSPDDTVAALARRGVDMVPASLPAALADQAQAVGNRLVKGVSYVGSALFFNLRQPPFDRPAARQAIVKALDLRQLVRVVGDADPAVNGFIHPASPWATAETLQAFDEQGARQAFAQLNLPPVEILAPANEPVKIETARQIALALERAGARATSRAVPVDDLAAAMGEGASPASFQAAVGVDPALASYDPDFLARLFGSDPQTATLNVMGYRSEAFDRVAARVGSTADPAARRQLVGEALRVLADDVPAVPLFFPEGIYAYRPVAYEGWVFVKGSGILDKRSFLEPAPSPSPTTTVGQAPSSPPAGAGTGLPMLGLVALGLLGVAGVVAVLLIRRRM